MAILLLPLCLSPPSLSFSPAALPRPPGSRPTFLRCSPPAPPPPAPIRSPQKSPQKAL
jgi:hypothetical protein